LNYKTLAGGVTIAVDELIPALPWLLCKAGSKSNSQLKYFGFKHAKPYCRTAYLVYSKLPQAVTARSCRMISRSRHYSSQDDETRQLTNKIL